MIIRAREMDSNKNLSKKIRNNESSSRLIDGLLEWEPVYALYSLICLQLWRKFLSLVPWNDSTCLKYKG